MLADGIFYLYLFVLFASIYMNADRDNRSAFIMKASLTLLRNSDVADVRAAAYVSHTGNSPPHHWERGAARCGKEARTVRIIAAG